MNSYDIAKQFKMLSVEEVDLLKKCAVMLPHNPVIVNIGANVGTSSVAVLEARPDAVVFSIDINPNILERSNAEDCGIDASRIIRILQSSQEVGKSFPYQVDMTFVDGGHTDEDLTGDIYGWIPKTKYIAVYHDYHHPNYKTKPNVNLDAIIDEAMKDWCNIGKARYMVAFARQETQGLIQGDYVID